LLIVVVVVVLLVVIIAGALLMWLHVDQSHADAVSGRPVPHPGAHGEGVLQALRSPPSSLLQVLRMGLWGGLAWEEDAATFYLDNGDGDAATVVYDYRNLLVSYRSRLHRACYITLVDKDNIPGLDAVAETFQRRQDGQRISLPLADRSLLGTTASILCSALPVYWA
ncbi:PSPC protein, partial [Mionectes macconnelli]|nr:PSPC protein [Mionectes macconnelli]